MAQTFWQRAQDPRCEADKKALEGRLSAIDERLVDAENILRLVETQAATIAQLQKEVAELKTRQTVLDDEITKTEHRLVTRLEGLEDETLGVDYSKGEAKADSASVVQGGFTKWTDRKRQAAAEQADPSKWVRKRPEPTPEPTAPKE